MKNHDLIKKRFIKKLPELKKNLGDIDEEIFNKYCKVLELNLEAMDNYFRIMEIYRIPTGFIGKSNTKSYLPNNKIKKKLNTAIKHLINFVRIKLELGFSIYSDYEIVFKNIITENSDREFHKYIENFSNHSDFDENLYYLIQVEIELQTQVDKRLLNNEFINAQKPREVYLKMFQFIGTSIQNCLHVRITSTYHRDEDSYGLFAKVIIWLFDVFEKPLPSSMDNMLKDAVKNLSDNWDKLEQSNSWDYPTVSPP